MSKLKLKSKAPV